MGTVRKLTPQENKVLKLIVKVHNEFMSMEAQHPSDAQHWVQAIHTLQACVAIRLVRRIEPKTFPKKV